MDPQAAHHIGQRELFPHWLVRDPGGLHVRDRELKDGKANGVVVTAVNEGARYAELDIRLGTVLSRVHQGLRLLAARLEEALC